MICPNIPEWKIMLVENSIVYYKTEGKVTEFIKEIY